VVERERDVVVSRALTARRRWKQRPRIRPQHTARRLLKGRSWSGGSKLSIHAGLKLSSCSVANLWRQKEARSQNDGELCRARPTCPTPSLREGVCYA
jgi:hypothetical protein